jgi:hypothetical protein
LKFTRNKSTHLLGHTQVSFYLAEPDATFKVCATPGGIFFEGTSPVISNRVELDSLAKVIGDAWKEHLSLKPKLASLSEGGG